MDGGCAKEFDSGHKGVSDMSHMFFFNTKPSVFQHGLFNLTALVTKDAVILQNSSSERTENFSLAFSRSFSFSLTLEYFKSEPRSLHDEVSLDNSLIPNLLLMAVPSVCVSVCVDGYRS